MKRRSTPVTIRRQPPFRKPISPTPADRPHMLTAHTCCRPHRPAAHTGRPPTQADPPSQAGRPGMPIPKPVNLIAMTRTSDQVPPRPAEQLRADARQNHARLITAATAAFAEKGADAPLEDIARRAGLGIGTLYRHFPTRRDLQAAVFRSQVGTVCGEGDTLLEKAPPGEAFGAWMRSLAGYLVTKRGLSHALIEAVGIESELISSCWMAMRQTTERLLG